MAFLAPYSDLAGASPAYCGCIKVYESRAAMTPIKLHPDGVTPMIGAQNLDNYNVQAGQGLSIRTTPIPLQDPPYFTLESNGGVVSGELSIWTPRDAYYGVARLGLGDRVEFWPDLTTKWAELLVTKIEMHEYSQVFTLAGYVRDFIGYPTRDPGEGTTLTSEVDIANHVRDEVIDERFTAANHYPWFPNSRDVVAPGRVESFGATNESDCEQTLNDLAACQLGQADDLTRPWFWGVTAGNQFYFKQRPNTAVITYVRHGTAQQTMIGSTVVTTLNVPAAHTTPFYNALDLAGQTYRHVYTYGSSGTGFYRMAREEVPTLDYETDMVHYKDGFFARFGTPKFLIEPLEILLPSAAALPLPWAGHGAIYWNGDVTTHTIRRVEVRFGAQPIAEVSFGEVEPPEIMSAKGSNPWRPGVGAYDAEGLRRRLRASAGSEGGTTTIQSLWPAYTGSY